MHRVIHAIVLRGTDTKEADRILTVLSAEEGKLSVIARAARKKNNALSGATELFAYSEMTVYEREGWTMLSDASAQEHFFGVRDDLALLSLASYFAELAELVAPEGESGQELLSLLLNALYALGTLKKPPELVKSAFELRLMCLAGYEPLLDSCAVCGEEEPKNAMFDVMRGVLHCGDCSAGDGGLSMPLPPQTLSAMRYVTLCDAKKLYSFSIDADALDKMSCACEAFAAAQLERGFKTLDFYKSVRGYEG